MRRFFFLPFFANQIGEIASGGMGNFCYFLFGFYEKVPFEVLASVFSACRWDIRPYTSTVQ